MEGVCYRCLVFVYLSIVCGDGDFSETCETSGYETSDFRNKSLGLNDAGQTVH